MISIDQAQRAILEQIAPGETVTVPLLQGLNLVTPVDHRAPWDLPLADNSAMDGYAFAHAALSGDRLRVSGFLPAGETPALPVPPGGAIRIMTGAPLPADCDTVVPIEDVTEEEGGILLTTPVKAGLHVRRRGEDIVQGSTVIPAGTLLRPQDIGMLAAMGTTAVPVCRRPRIAILSTGDELLEPGSIPIPGKIIDSNRYSLAAQVLAAGGEPLLLGIAADTLEATCERMQTGLSADFIVISGGVSVGDRDFVKEAIEKLGGSVLFWKVDMKPGKPLAFALVAGKPVFALPGNPVAAMVSFELFVRPAICKALGRRQLFRPTVTALLEEPVTNRGKRPHLARGIATLRDGRYRVSTTGNQSSGRLSSLVKGNCLIVLAPEADLATGDSVPVTLLDHGFALESLVHGAL